MNLKGGEVVSEPTQPSDDMVLESQSRNVRALAVMAV